MRAADERFIAGADTTGINDTGVMEGVACLAWERPRGEGLCRVSRAEAEGLEELKAAEPIVAVWLLRLPEEPYRKIWYKSKNWVVGLADKDYPTPPRMYQVGRLALHVLHLAVGPRTNACAHVSSAWQSFWSAHVSEVAGDGVACMRMEVPE